MSYHPPYQRKTYIPREVAYSPDYTQRHLVNPDCVVENPDQMRAFVIEVLLLQGGDRVKLKEHPMFWPAVRAGLIRTTLDRKKGMVVTARGEQFLQIQQGCDDGQADA